MLSGHFSTQLKATPLAFCKVGGKRLKRLAKYFVHTTKHRFTCASFFLHLKISWSNFFRLLFAVYPLFALPDHRNLAHYVFLVQVPRSWRYGT